MQRRFLHVNANLRGRCCCQAQVVGILFSSFWGVVLPNTQVEKLQDQQIWTFLLSFSSRRFNSLSCGACHEMAISHQKHAWWFARHGTQTVDADTCKKRSVINDDDGVRTRNRFCWSDQFSSHFDFATETCCCMILTFFFSRCAKDCWDTRAGASAWHRQGIRASEWL